ncbi:unnamed protein product [Gongylonema pulchrum]|uniref:Myotubularin phosphatase domain-containing protein n=1 Tax=Gongylonema pulchrum TaxID=637853 RepID=A0A183D375_9BILA|nr:unnamed protein product [Gongylonema pulchrum]
MRCPWRLLGVVDDNDQRKLSRSLREQKTVVEYGLLTTANGFCESFSVRSLVCSQMVDTSKYIAPGGAA